ncbi:isoprenyl transferase [Chitinimonas arctica]|uniref:Isoprenyl transferase n=1 Tax=Chitinimonas arctica TaxID=2594795 RepID=A0A516SAQ0_9NEIS|nr:isoprenyl transferase [Chitinimonas arctica]QDQ25234.1 isoprenyl transferase [Chitinimonas arctica]
MVFFKSSTKDIPAVAAVPAHIAIIMDGNGRWAKKRFLPRVAGHKQGVESLREAVKACDELGVKYLTLFAFSSENWRRPPEEVSFLMGLFLSALEREVVKLDKNGIRLKLIGRRDHFAPEIVRSIEAAEARTAANTGLTLTIAADYGGRWDILNAMQAMLKERPSLREGEIGEEDLAPYLAMSYAPEPDLFIRTGGEARVSNFLLWQLAYTEFYFTEAFWPDFDRAALEAAIASYRHRERRFGRTSEQLKDAAC